MVMEKGPDIRFLVRTEIYLWTATSAHSLHTLLASCKQDTAEYFL
jgi:hypothetical protein